MFVGITNISPRERTPHRRAGRIFGNFRVYGRYVGRGTFDGHLSVSYRLLRSAKETRRSWSFATRHQIPKIKPNSIPLGLALDLFELNRAELFGHYADAPKLTNLKRVCAFSNCSAASWPSTVVFRYGYCSARSNSLSLFGYTSVIFFCGLLMQTCLFSLLNVYLILSLVVVY